MLLLRWCCRVGAAVMLPVVVLPGVVLAGVVLPVVVLLPVMVLLDQGSRYDTLGAPG